MWQWRKRKKKEPEEVRLELHIQKVEPGPTIMVSKDSGLGQAIVESAKRLRLDEEEKDRNSTS